MEDFSEPSYAILCTQSFPRRQIQSAVLLSWTTEHLAALQQPPEQDLELLLELELNYTRMSMSSDSLQELNVLEEIWWMHLEKEQSK